MLGTWHRQSSMYSAGSSVRSIAVDPLRLDTHITHPARSALPDRMSIWWPENEIETLVKVYVEKWKIDLVRGALRSENDLSSNQFRLERSSHLIITACPAMPITERSPQLSGPSFRRYDDDLADDAL